MSHGCKLAQILFILTLIIMIGSSNILLHYRIRVLPVYLLLLHEFFHHLTQGIHITSQTGSCDLHVRYRHGHLKQSSQLWGSRALSTSKKQYLLLIGAKLEFDVNTTDVIGYSC